MKPAATLDFFGIENAPGPFHLYGRGSEADAKRVSEDDMAYKEFARKTGRGLALSAALLGAVSLTAAPSVAYADRGHHGGWHGGGHWGGHHHGGGGAGIALGLLGGALAGAAIANSYYSYPYYGYSYPYYGGGYAYPYYGYGYGY
jgi:hypothetical protein